MLRFDFKADGWPASSLCFDAPVEIVSACAVDDVVPAIESAAEAAGRGFWVAGYVAYEASPAFDRSFRTHPACGEPLAWFGIFREPHNEPSESTAPTTRIDEWKPTITRCEYDRCINEIRQAAGRGDLYQANYTFPLCAARTPLDTYAMYRNLQRTSGCGYGAYIDTGDFIFVSLSPELFFQFNRSSGAITTRPMKGTRTRGRWIEEDERLASALGKSEKDRAENLMIVDLLRNDLGRIAVPGSVRAPHLFEVERYPTVWQMTSTITATARSEISISNIFQALFPCGSVTGAPKIAAMQKIAELERSPRGIYCGAIGMVRPGGDAVFSVAIRTITIDRSTEQASYHVGGGITWDSKVDDEYDEALSKANVVAGIDPEFELVETLRLENGVFYLWKRHVDRITASARYFGRPLTHSSVECALSLCAEAHPEKIWRVRLLADSLGAVRTECAPLDTAEGKQLFRVAHRPICSRDRFLFHKTTNRRVYEYAMERCEDVFDVLLTNERGELTEFTRGNLVIEIGERLITPPIRCGLLAGTLRQEIIEIGKAVEQIITADMLRRADRIWFINSIRGWVEMEQTLE